MPEKNKGFNSPLVDDEMIKTIIRFEDDIPYMYLDTKGKVTVGPGFHLQNKGDAARRPFRHMAAEDKFDRPATAAEVTDAYDRVSKKPAGNYGANKYNPFNDDTLSRIGIDPDYSRTEMRRFLEREEEMLRSKIRDFDSLPKPARRVLLDMQYNIGDRKFRPEYKDDNGAIKPAWPKLFDALNKRDYRRAAEELRSNDVNDPRNKWRRDTMLESLLSE